MYGKLLAIIEKIENAPITLGAWMASFLAIVLGRLALEHFFADFHFQFADHYFYHFTHEFLSFLATFMLALLVVRFAGRVTLEKAAAFLTLGFLIIWTPPITDEIISRGVGFWSFYTFDSLAGLFHRYLTFFGDKPEIGTTYGVRLEIAIAIVLVSLYAFLKSKNILRSLFVALVLYTLLFALGSSPALVTIATEGFQKGFFQVSEADVAARMLSPAPLFGLTPPNLISTLNVKMSIVFAVIDIVLVALILFVFFRPYFLALWKNARFPQLVYHAGLFLLGASFALLYAKSAFVLDLFHILGLIVMIAAVECAWLASVVVNDLHDEKIDALTNKHRPVPTGSIPLPLYKTMGALFFAASLILMALVSTQGALLLAVYQGIAWLYSGWPLRLKRFPLVATALAALASLLVFFAGYVVFSLDKNLAGLPWQIPLFLFGAYTLLLPIKDFKDIAGDRADGVYTLPVLLGEVWAKRVIGGPLFILFIASVFLLHVERLFWLAFFFGSLAYWLLDLATEKHRYFNYHRLADWFVALASAYGLFLALALL